MNMNNTVEECTLLFIGRLTHTSKKNCMNQRPGRLRKIMSSRHDMNTLKAKGNDSDLNWKDFDRNDLLKTKPTNWL